MGELLYIQVEVISAQVFQPKLGNPLREQQTHHTVKMHLIE